MFYLKWFSTKRKWLIVHYLFMQVQSLLRFRVSIHSDNLKKMKYLSKQEMLIFTEINWTRKAHKLMANLCMIEKNQRKRFWQKMRKGNMRPIAVNHVSKKKKEKEKTLEWNNYLHYLDLKHKAFRYVKFGCRKATLKKTLFSITTSFLCQSKFRIHAQNNLK